MLDEQDPFELKAKQFSNVVSSKLRRYNQIVGHGKETRNDTSLVYLILKTNLIFDDQEYCLILGINSNNPRNFSLFESISYQVNYVADALYKNTGFPSLIKFPLTDIKETCYVMAMTFKAVFFVPTVEKLKISVSYHDQQMNDNHSSLPYSSHSVSDVSNSSNGGQADNTQENNIRMSSSDSSNDSFVPLSSSFGPTVYREEDIIRFNSRYNQMWVLVSMLNKAYTNVAKKDMGRS